MIRNKEDAGHVIFTASMHRENSLWIRKKIYTFITREWGGGGFHILHHFSKNAYEREIQQSSDFWIRYLDSLVTQRYLINWIKEFDSLKEKTLERARKKLRNESEKNNSWLMITSI